MKIMHLKVYLSALVLCSRTFRARRWELQQIRQHFYWHHLNFPPILDIGHVEAVALRCSVKRLFLKISQNSQENTCVRVSFLIKLQAWGLINFNKKKTLAQVFFCEFCKISKNTFLIEQEHLRWLLLGMEICYF